jgi:DHA1 family tetracycline resistance protein-like MFS transporter
MDKPGNQKGKAALGFIFITLFIDVLGLGIIIPILPKLLEQLAHVDLSTATQISGYLTFTYASMQFLFSPVLGNLSDRFGRRPVLLGSLLGFGVDYLFMATAYIADVSTGDKRAANFGLVGAASGLGFILGIGMGGFLGAISVKLPFIVAAGLALLNALYGFFVLPESLAPENRRKFEWKRANPISALTRLGKYDISISTLITAFTIVYIGQKAVESTLPFFLIEKYQWTLSSISGLGIFIGILLVGIQGGLIRIVIPKLGLEKSVIAGMAFYTIGLIFIAFNNIGWMMYVYMIPYCLGGISGPALQGFITEKIAPNEQGELQGALTSLVSVTTIVGPLLMTSLFHHFTMKGTAVYFPGAPYLMGAVLMLLSILLAIRSFKKASAVELKKA